MDEEFRPDHSLFFIGESYEYEGVTALDRLQALEQTGQQRRSAPVVDHSAAGIDEIEMTAHNDRRIGLSRQRTNYVGRLGVLHRLLGQALAGASGRLKQRS